jgi:hypothetical protein
MKLHFRRMVLVAALVLSVVATGCAAVRATPTMVPEPPTSTPAAGDAGGQVVTGTARVEEIEILILESFPVQVNVVARGNLPDGCTTIDRIDRERQGNAFVVTITTVRPADQACTEALVPFEEIISLDVMGLEAGTYTVEVNGARDTFELAVDNRLPDEGQFPGGRGTTDGAIVDDVAVAVDKQDPALLLVTIRGNLRDGCTQLVDAVPTIQGSEIQIDLVTQRPPDLQCTQALVPFEETVPVSVAGLEPGRYEVVVQDVRTAVELGGGTGPDASVPGCA